MWHRCWRGIAQGTINVAVLQSTFCVPLYFVFINTTIAAQMAGARISIGYTMPTASQDLSAEPNFDNLKDVHGNAGARE